MLKNAGKRLIPTVLLFCLDQRQSQDFADHATCELRNNARKKSRHRALVRNEEKEEETTKTTNVCKCMCMRDLSLSDGFSYYCNESFHIHIMRFFFTLKSDRCLVVVQSFLSSVDLPSPPPFFFFFFFVSSSSLRRTKRKSSPLLAFFSPSLSCRSASRTSNEQ